MVKLEYTIISFFYIGICTLLRKMLLTKSDYIPEQQMISTMPQS